MNKRKMINYCWSEMISFAQCSIQREIKPVHPMNVMIDEGCGFLNSKFVAIICYV